MWSPAGRVRLEQRFIGGTRSKNIYSTRLRYFACIVVAVGNADRSGLGNYVVVLQNEAMLNVSGQMDNLSTHSAHILRQHLPAEVAEQMLQRFEIHYTPVHASWLNQAEIAIGMYSRLTSMR